LASEKCHRVLDVNI